MLKLHEFYDKLDRCATIKLCDEESGAIIYEGKVKSIPDGYDYCTVWGFRMHGRDCFWFYIA